MREKVTTRQRVPQSESRSKCPQAFPRFTVTAISMIDLQVSVIIGVTKKSPHSGSRHPRRADDDHASVDAFRWGCGVTWCAFELWCTLTGCSPNHKKEDFRHRRHRRYANRCWNLGVGKVSFVVLLRRLSQKKINRKHKLHTLTSTGIAMGMRV